MKKAVSCQLSAICLIAAVSIGCAESTEPIWQMASPTMGTRYNVSLVGGDQERAEQIREAIDDRLVGINQRMSTYDPESELSLFNASDSSDWFAVSRETASVVASAVELASDSGGAYDPTVGPVVNLWGFGPGRRRDAPPTDQEIMVAHERVGFAAVQTRLDPPALRKQNRSVYVDLSSIAKGHGVDAIANLLEEEGVSSYMVEIGGEVRTAGTKPNGSPWRIGIERVPEVASAAGGSRRIARVVELTGHAMATSGDYQNYFEHGGKRYSHTIDPTTGRPVSHSLATVTVIADTCREADGLATALLVLGPDAGYDWATERGIAALFVSRGEQDQLAEKTTPDWETLTAKPAEPATP